MKLRAKIILILLFISVVPIFVVGYIETINARRVLEKQFGEDAVEYGHYVLGSLHRYLDYVCKDIHDISHAVTMEDFSGRLREKKIKKISRYLDDSNIFYDFFIIRDASGRKVAENKSENIGPEFIGKDGFEEALAGKGNIQSPVNDDFRGYKVMMVSFPITDNTGNHNHDMDDVHVSEQLELEKEEVRGVLMVALRWGRLKGIIESTRDRTELNETTSKVILMSNNGHLYFDNGRELLSPTNLIALGMESARRACRKETGYLMEMNMHGEETFIAYTHFRSPKYKFTRDIDWSILIERDPKLVFASVTAMRKTLGYAIGGCVVVLVLVSFIFSGRLSKPILALSKAAKDFGGGDLSSRVMISRRDEIGTLERSFNSMAEQVEKYSDSLVSEVKLRTAELEDANTELVVHMEELERSDEALRRSEETYRTLVENVDIGVAMVDANHNIIFVNRAQCKMFNNKPDDLIGKKCYNAFAKREAICAYCPGVIAMKSGKMEMVETEGVRDDGTHFSVQIMASPLYDSDNNPRGFIELVEDISERKNIESELRQYQNKLRSLASKLTLSEEHERRRIAGGLHNSIIQPLVFIKMKLETLLNKSEQGEKLEASMKRMRDEVTGLITMTRGFTFDLSYPVLYEFGLEAAMEEWLKEEIEDKHKLKTEFSDDGDEKPIDDDMRAFLFGAYRELLVNIIKHAKAEKINVAVSRDEGKMIIRVEDDGIGFDCSETRPVITKESGFGLFGIRDRLEYLGGDFKIESEAASGTVVTLCAPLRRSV